jgi:hypothetical protein
MTEELEYLIEQKVDVKYHLNDEHIFLVTAWTNTIEKEKMLVECLKKLKEFNIPILLAIQHIPVIDEIQKLVDYYIFENSNEILPFEKFEETGLNSYRYTSISNHRVVNWEKYNHHYAVLSNIKNAFLFCNSIGKKIIHYVEYDCIIDTKQFYETFMKDIEEYDFVIKPVMFSIKIDLALKVITEIPNSMYEYYKRPYWSYHNFFSDGLAPYEFSYIAKYTNKIKICDYIDNDKTINLVALHNDRGGLLYGLKMPNIFLAIDSNDLFIHFISNRKIFLEIKYNTFEKFLWVRSYDLINIGKYIQEKSVVVKVMGIEIFRQMLNEDLISFKKRNYIEKI